MRDAHSNEDGSIVKLGKRFPVTGLLYPQDVTGEPAETINCRCVALIVTKV